MTGGMTLHGVKEIKVALFKHREKYGAGMTAGLTLAGLFLQRKSMEIVPIDTGNLRGGAFTRKEGQRYNTRVFVGYTAKYAVYVHEDPDARHKEGKSYKYLEIPLRRHRDTMAKIVRIEMQKRKTI